MVNINLSGKLTARIVRVIANKVIKKKFGEDANLLIDDLKIITENGLVRMRVNAEIAIPEDEAARILGNA